MLFNHVSFLIPYIYLICLLPHFLSVPTVRAIQPYQQLTCIGKPSQQLPTLGNFDPNKLTLQDLCRDGGVDSNIGGYCQFPPPQPEESGRISFRIYVFQGGDEPAPGTFNQDVLNVIRFRAECQLRCFCTSLFIQYDNGSLALQPRADLTIQPKYIAHSGIMGAKYPRRLYEQSRKVGQITIDQRDNAFPDPRNKTWAEYQSLALPTLGTYGDREVAYESIEVSVNARSNPGQQVERMSIDQINYITCKGPMPTYVLPAPWSVAEYNSTIMHTPNNLTALCAVYQSGGYR